MYFPLFVKCLCKCLSSNLQKYNVTTVEKLQYLNIPNAPLYADGYITCTCANKRKHVSFSRENILDKRYRINGDLRMALMTENED